MNAMPPKLIAKLPLSSKAEVRICLDSVNGQSKIDVRTWADYRAGPVEIRGPTVKGVNLPISDLPALLAALEAAVTVARATGLLSEGTVQ